MMRRLLLLPALLIVGSIPGESQTPASEPAAGVFLVAKPEMPDPRFQETVILLLAHDDDGSMGLVINRPTDITIPGTLNTPHLIYRGGPVAANQFFALGRGTPPEGPSQPLWEDVWWSTQRRVIETLLAEEATPDGLRVFTGYAGWGAGQLDAELQAVNSWVLLEADPDDVFSQETESLWDRLIGRNRPLLAWHRAALLRKPPDP